MIDIPAGEVALSDRRTQRRWTVDVRPFRLAAVPVTRALFAEVTGERPGGDGGDPLPVESVTWWDALRFCNELSGRDGLTSAYLLTEPAPGTSRPVPGSLPPGGPIERNHRLPPEEDLLPGGDIRDRVTWDRAADGYRLPTEAEWEHACRAGTSGPRYGPLDDIAWHRGNSGERPHPVGTLLPNSWGLHDMLGNVWEWCWDFYDPEVYGSYRVLRGGGWFDEHWSCRASVRRRSHPTLHLDDVGFRVARTPQP
jgi:sulfatase modifying factor 1